MYCALFLLHLNWQQNPNKLSFGFSTLEVLNPATKKTQQASSAAGSVVSISSYHRKIRESLAMNAGVGKFLSFSCWHQDDLVPAASELGMEICLESSEILHIFVLFSVPIYGTYNRVHIFSSKGEVV
jgi:hypothetical protein